jgi:fructose-specific PTS system IIA-like component
MPNGLRKQHVIHVAPQSIEFRTGEFEAPAESYLDRPGQEEGSQCAKVLANVSSAEEVGVAIEKGADGIGLFRTEALFIDRTEPPSEDDQTAAYAEAVDAAQGRTITLRTFDFGAEMAPPYIDLARESNPFLGYRGARIYSQFGGMLRTQLRAIFRVAHRGNLKIVAPMIATAEELRGFHAVTVDVRKDFPGTEVPIGMMLEVPSAVFAMPELSEWADFFCFSTDSMAQYFFAANRDNARMKDLYEWRHPSFFRLLKVAIDNAGATSRSIAFCGDISDKEDAQTILLGLGMTHLITDTGSIRKAKKNLAHVDMARCRQLAAVALISGNSDTPEPELIGLNSGARNKFHVMKELSHRLAAADANASEETVWAREETDFTRAGHGVALLRCKSNQIAVHKIIVIRLRNPIDWGSLDGVPVSVVILLATPESTPRQNHLQIYSRLSRLLMQERMCSRLRAAPGVSAMLAIIREKLNIKRL